MDAGQRAINMSGYLVPASHDGPFSKTFVPEYALKPSQHNQPEATYPARLPRDAIPSVNASVSVGPSDAPILKIPVLGFGIWAWGDTLTYGWNGKQTPNGYDANLNEQSIAGAFDKMLQLFPRVFIDTAEFYGVWGLSESLLGDLIQERLRDNQQRIVLATKFFPHPFRHPWSYPQCVVEAFGGSLSRTKLDNIDIWQLHGPSNGALFGTGGFWPRLVTIVDSFTEAYKHGHMRGVGVCNLSREQTEFMYDEFEKRGVPMVSVQVEFSLLRMDAWKHGFIDWAHSKNLAFIAYTPIGLGRLTGKYSSTILPRGNRNFGHVSWSKIQPIVDQFLRIGSIHGKTPTAVALNWVMCKGAIPIPTAKNAGQVLDISESLGWTLTREEEQELDAVGLVDNWDCNLLKHWQNWWWQQG
ncbi:hypothetical protein QFC22_004000 [Naganishia vaughanmartiniae]|uniref:Uncharacterized protein n=1 Tax=Naganishia vaughanmartiniae TaxID=1424756 RepID=A0ACC2X374_9TREE|nr:hypothetical protein QFC22_004000 [Naganishia vaughanmartiniae]